jgi:hypothetical protein
MKLLERILVPIGAAPALCLESLRIRPMTSQREFGVASEDNRVQDWSELAEGVKVAITEPNNDSYSAIVDTKTADSAVVWIIDDWGQRRAFDHREGIEFAVTK